MTLKQKYAGGGGTKPLLIFLCLIVFRRVDNLHKIVLNNLTLSCRAEVESFILGENICSD